MKRRIALYSVCTLCMKAAIKADFHAYRKSRRQNHTDLDKQDLKAEYDQHLKNFK